MLIQLYGSGIFLLFVFFSLVTITLIVSLLLFCIVYEIHWLFIRRFESWMPVKICMKKWCNLSGQYHWWRNYKTTHFEIDIGYIWWRKLAIISALIQWNSGWVICLLWIYINIRLERHLLNIDGIWPNDAIIRIQNSISCEHVFNRSLLKKLCTLQTMKF